MDNDLRILFEKWRTFCETETFNPFCYVWEIFYNIYKKSNVDFEEYFQNLIRSKEFKYTDEETKCVIIAIVMRMEFKSKCKGNKISENAKLNIKEYANILKINSIYLNELIVYADDELDVSIYL